MQFDCLFNYRDDKKKKVGLNPQHNKRLDFGCSGNPVPSKVYTAVIACVAINRGEEGDRNNHHKDYPQELRDPFKSRTMQWWHEVGEERL